MSKREISEETIRIAKGTAMHSEYGHCPFKKDGDIECEWISVHHCNVCIHSADFRATPIESHDIPKLIPSSPTPFEILEAYFVKAPITADNIKGIEELLEQAKSWRHK